MAEIYIDPATVPVDERSDFELIADCEPLAQIISDELVVKDNGARQRLVLCWEILDGPHAKRRIWDSLNIVNPSADAENISKRAVIRLCEIHGIPTPLRDSSLLHFKPTRIKVRTDPPKNGYDAKNVIKGYSSATGAVPAAPPAAASTPTAGASAPWRS
jgi:hypothetical protein